MGRLLTAAAAAALAAQTASAALRPAFSGWSADGRRYLSASGRSLVLFDASGAKAGSYDAPSELQLALLSPDGRRVAFAPAPGELWVWDSAAGTASRLCAPQSPMQACVDPQWSPDGTRLAYGLMESRALGSPFDDPVKRYSVLLAAMDGTAAKTLVVYEH